MTLKTGERVKAESLQQFLNFTSFTLYDAIESCEEDVVRGYNQVLEQNSSNGEADSVEDVPEEHLWFHIEAEGEDDVLFQMLKDAEETYIKLPDTMSYSVVRVDG